MSTYKPTDNQKALLAFLGSAYSIKQIDLEMCLYRKLNANYDIEIVGTYRKNQPISVFVWHIRNGVNYTAQIAEEVRNITDWDVLKNTLDSLIDKYTL